MVKETQYHLPVILPSQVLFFLSGHLICSVFILIVFIGCFNWVVMVFIIVVSSPEGRAGYKTSINKNK